MSKAGGTSLPAPGTGRKVKKGPPRAPRANGSACPKRPRIDAFDPYRDSRRSLVALGPAGTIRRANRAAARLMGMSQSQLVGAPFIDLVAPESRRAFRLFLRQAFARPAAAVGELTLVHRRRTSFSAALDCLGVQAAGRGRCVHIAFRDISERKAAEKKLGRQTEHLFRLLSERASELEATKKENEAILQAMTEPVFIYDARGQAVKVNAAGLTMLGLDSLTPGTSYVRLFLEASFKYPSGKAIPLQNLPARLALEGQRVSQCLVLVNRLGERYIIQAGASPLRHRGKVWGAVELWTDITEREDLLSDLIRDRLELESRVRERTAALTKTNKDLWQEVATRRKVEEANSQTNRLLERVFSSIGVHIAYLDSEFTYIRVNRAFAQAAGHTPEFFIGKNHFLQFPDPEIQAVFQEVLDTAKPYFAYERQFFPPGRTGRAPTFWDWSVQPVTESDGRVSGIVLSLADVTQRRRLEYERLLLSSAIDQAHEPIVVMDTRGSVQYSNTAFESLVGLKQADILGRLYYDLGSERLGKQEFQRAARYMLLQGRPWTGRLRRRKKDGTEVVLDVVLAPLRDEFGRVSNLSAVERDVSREIFYEEHLRQSQKLEALGTLSGGIAHDFNNLLMPIMINTELALFETQAGDSVHRKLQTVLQAAQRAKALVNQIVAFSRRVEEKGRPMRLQSVIKETLEFIKTSLPANIEIRERLEAGSGIAEVDPTQIHQVVMNLCTNAVQAMKKEGGILEVSLTRVEASFPEADASAKEAAPRRYLRLGIADTGEGIEPLVIGRIFDPFFTTKPPQEGTGMGLAVVHGIVKAHRGVIQVESVPGKETTFLIFLPEAASVALPETEPEREVPKGKERILLVDDEELVLQGEKQMLERLGYQVTAKTESPDALQTFVQDPGAFDLVITDQIMPKLTGTRLAQEMLRLRPDLPIMICTGFADSVDVAQAKKLGIKAFLKKPFFVRELAETIRETLAPAASAAVHS